MGEKERDYSGEDAASSSTITRDLLGNQIPAARQLGLYGQGYVPHIVAEEERQPWDENIINDNYTPNLFTGYVAPRQNYLL